MAGFRLDAKLRGFDVAVKRFRRAEESVDRRVMIALTRSAMLGERELKRGIRSGRPGGERFKKLSKITRLLRAGKKPLIDKGDLWGSITTKTDTSARQAFVGILRTARSGDGESLVNLALIHEFGTKPYGIRVTEKMRKFFWYLHFKSGKKINPIAPDQQFVLHPGVPARPFIRPVFKKIGPKINKLVRLALTENGGPI